MQSSRFRSSYLKIDRAKKHLSDFHDMFVAFSRSNFRSMRIEEHPEQLRTHSLRIEINAESLNKLADDASTLIGDILHNLRSALDHTYFETVTACGGKPTSHTRFPITDTKKNLEDWLIQAFQKKQITDKVKAVILDSVKPYEAGNPAIFGLHELNIMDKHQRIVPTLKLVGFFNVRLEDEHGNRIGRGEYIADESCLIPLTGTYGKKVKLKDEGSPSANIIFDLGASVFQGEAVFPALRGVAEEVARTIEAFDFSIG